MRIARRTLHYSIAKGANMTDRMDKARTPQRSISGNSPINQKPEVPSAQPFTHEEVQRALHTPSALSAADVTALQRTMGNVAVQRLLAGRVAPEQPRSARALVVQPKLNVGPADDKYEREADRVAEQIAGNAHSMPVAAASQHSVQRREEEDGVQMKPESVAVTQRVQRKNRSEDDQVPTQAAVGLEGGVVSGDLERAIHNPSGGRALPDVVRRKLEPTLGTDLSHVRAHTDSRAATLNRQINAKAFTHKNHIYYGAGQSPADLRLTAHETVHTIQQGATPQNSAQRMPISTGNGSVVQRYSAKVFKSGSRVDWQAETAAVKGSSEGAAGGVRFFKGTAGPVTDIVVKPHYGDDANEGRAQLQHTLINTVGLTAPQSRLISLGSQEGIAIAATAKAQNAEIPTELHEDFGMMEGEEGKKLRFIQIMGKAEGQSVAAMTSKTESTQDVDKVLAQLGNTSLLVKIGKLIAVDVFSGNTDRINTNKTNLGNLMVEADRLTAIDNEINIGDLDVNNSAGKLRLMNLGDLFKGAKPYATNYVKNIVASIFLGTGKRDDESQEDYEKRRQALADHVDKEALVRAWSPWIEEGIRQGRTEIISLLTRKGRKKDRKSLKKQAGKFSGGGSTSYEGMKQQAEYMRLRQGGDDHKTATPKVGEYKTKRSSFKQRVKRWFG
jgi:hypothetical protein